MNTTFIIINNTTTYKVTFETKYRTPAGYWIKSADFTHKSNLFWFISNRLLHSIIKATTVRQIPVIFTRNNHTIYIILILISACSQSKTLCNMCNDRSCLRHCEAQIFAYSLRRCCQLDSLHLTIFIYKLAVRVRFCCSKTCLLWKCA